MNKELRIIFMGTPEFSVPTLKKLCEQGYRPIAVYTQPDRINGRGKKVIFSPVKAFALKEKISLLQPTTMKDKAIQDELQSLRPDLLIVIAYGQILPQSILDIPTYGAINVHASLLPKYRGAAPIQRVILNGEKETGVTIMHLDAGMDTGPIVLQKKMDIGRHMMAGELFESLSEIGATAVLQVLENLPLALKKEVSQNHDKATYAEKITKDMSHIDWMVGAEEIDRKIRGLHPNPGTYTFFRGKRLKIHGAFWEERTSEKEPGTIISVKNDHIYVATGKGIIVLTCVQPENHKGMKIKDFINGYQVEENEQFTEH